MEELLGQHVPIDDYIDSKTVFDVVSKQGSTAERRLLSNVCALRESYANGELDEIAWIPGVTNASDAMTKQAISQYALLSATMKTNRTNIGRIGWEMTKKTAEQGVSSERSRTMLETEEGRH